MHRPLDAGAAYDPQGRKGAIRAGCRGWDPRVYSPLNLTTMETLSPEVIIDILDFLRGNSRGLHHLSITSSTFTAPSQALLFADFTLCAPTERGSGKVKDYLQFLAKSPQIKSYIHGLRIIDYSAYPYDPWVKDHRLAETL